MSFVGDTPKLEAVRFNPVADLTALNALPSPVEGETRYVLSEKSLYTYDAVAPGWVDVGSGGVTPPGGTPGFTTPQAQSNHLTDTIFHSADECPDGTIVAASLSDNGVTATVQIYCNGVQQDTFTVGNGFANNNNNGWTDRFYTPTVHCISNTSVSIGYRDFSSPNILNRIRTFSISSGTLTQQSDTLIYSGPGEVFRAGFDNFGGNVYWWRIDQAGDFFLARSTDAGINWASETNPLTVVSGSAPAHFEVTDEGLANERLWLCHTGNSLGDLQLRYSDDFGVTWNQITLEAAGTYALYGIEFSEEFDKAVITYTQFTGPSGATSSANVYVRVIEDTTAATGAVTISARQQFGDLAGPIDVSNGLELEGLAEVILGNNQSRTLQRCRVIDALRIEVLYARYQGGGTSAPPGTGSVQIYRVSWNNSTVLGTFSQELVTDDAPAIFNFACSYLINSATEAAIIYTQATSVASALSEGRLLSREINSGTQALEAETDIAGKASITVGGPLHRLFVKDRLASYEQEDGGNIEQQRVIAYRP